eukprot:GEZU01016558.1.p1 GENE.GEZU01016558.1~~GEZU01016558.1.p1  ORF type:complete len:305 (+),score=78.42 GEZU01016558.1:412-1326(+)
MHSPMQRACSSVRDSEGYFQSYFELINKEDDYPYAQLIVGGIFLVLVGIEKLIVNHSHHHHHHASHHQVIDDDGDDISATKKLNRQSHSIITPGGGGGGVPPPLGARSPQQQQPTMTTVMVNQHQESSSLEDDGGAGAMMSKNPNVALFDKEASTMSAINMVVALCVHSFFEGLGFGAANTAKRSYGILIALVSHKMLEAFALGLGVFRGKFKRRWLPPLLLFIYSLGTPVGIAIGLGTEAEMASTSASSLIGGILSSIATGSFLYISTFEMLPNELADNNNLIFKLILILLGWGLMVFLAKFT